MPPFSRPPPTTTTKHPKLLEDTFCEARRGPVIPLSYTKTNDLRDLEAAIENEGMKLFPTVAPGARPAQAI